jgi:cytochrome c2
MMAMILLMVWSDFDRPWKEEQREEMKWESNRVGIEAMVLETRTQQLRKDLEKARRAAEKAVAKRRDERKDLAEELNRAQGDWYQRDADYKKQKQYTAEAEYFVHEAQDAAERDRWLAILEDHRDFEHRLRDAEQEARERRDSLHARIDELDAAIAEAEASVLADGTDDEGRQRRGELKKLQLLEQRRTQTASYNPVREIPLLDFLAPPTKVEQVVLDNLVDNYEFATPKKVDRCGTCHIGATRVGFEPEKWPLEVLDEATPGPERVRRFEEGVYRFVQSLVDSIWPKVPASSRYPYEHGLLRDLEVHHETLSMLFADYDPETGEIGVDRKSGRKNWRRWVKSDKGWKSDPKGKSLADYYLAALQGMKRHWLTHPHSDLMVGPQSAHPYESFGCTTCHLGRGWSTDFGYAFHSPSLVRDDKLMTEERAKAQGFHLPASASMKLEEAMAMGNVAGGAATEGWTVDHGQAERWEHELGRTETKLHYWNWPQHAKQLVQASCLKCHKEGLYEPPPEEYANQRTGKPDPEVPVTVAYEDQAMATNPDAAAEPGRMLIPKDADPYDPESLRRGMDGFLRFGCYGCHKLDPEEYPLMKGQRAKQGPPLDPLASKTTREFALKWVRNPKDFREETRMPRFWGLSNNSHRFRFRFAQDGYQDVDGIAWGESEVYSIVEWMFEESASRSPALPAVDLSKGDAKRGEKIVAGDAVATEGLAKACVACHDVPITSPDVKVDFAGMKAWTDPKTGKVFGWGERMSRRQGPSLEGIGSKVKAEWLVAWLKDPRGYWHDTNMPNLRLTEQEALDVAAYLMTLKATAFDELDRTDPVEMNAGIVKRIAQELKVAEQAEPTPRALDIVERMSDRERTLYVGKKLFKHYGCFGCHQVETYKDATPIGTELTKWGSKVVERLLFNHVPIAQTRFDFAYWKLANPRIYDWGMPGADLPFDRLKMPRFGFTPEEAKDIATFLVGLVEDPIPAKSLFHPDPREKDLIAGRKVVDRYNCKGCHVIEGEGGDVWAAIDAKNDKVRPPNLVGQGGKTDPRWLFEFLKNPVPLRPFHSIRMPTFGLTDDEDRTLVAYFAALSRAPYPFEERAADSLQGPDYAAPKSVTLKDPADPTRTFTVTVKNPVEEARAMFQAYACKSCHSQDPAKKPLERAPDFLHSRRDGRLRGGWIPTWLWNPSQLLPGTAMPSFFGGGVAQETQFFDGNAERQIEALRDYILHHYQETDR